MKKLLFLPFFIFSCFLNGNALGDLVLAQDYFYLSEKTYGCNTPMATNFTIPKGHGYVTLGWIYDNDTGTNYWSPYMLCGGDGMFKDKFTISGTYWCSNSVIREGQVENARYCLVPKDEASATYCSTTEKMNIRDKKGASKIGWALQNACVYANCLEGYTFDGSQKCIKNTPVVQEDDEEDDEKRDDSKSSLERCLESRTTEEGKACCYLRSTVAKYNFQTQKCECTNDGTFEIAADGRGGTCKVSGGDGDDGRSVTPPDDDESIVQPVVTETYKCDPTKLAFISKWQIDCKDKQNIITQIEVINAHCNGLNPEKETFDTYYKMLQALNPDECAIENARKAAEEQIRAKKVQEFKSKFSTLEKIEGGFGDKSVWKNKDGKFNTARLASDSIAGVVLGTAGGLITSHVVKKNQEKSGFEDIKCTVGGQEIGDFGDQMNVGIN